MYLIGLYKDLGVSEKDNSFKLLLIRSA